MFTALAGLTAGATHALSGPDHVAAVLPLAADAPRQAARIGFTWALGHGLGTIVLAAIVLGIRTQLDLHHVGGGLEALVGVALALTGVWTLARAYRGSQHASGGHTHGVALGIGTLHGLAGGAHVLVAISAMALPISVAAGWIGAFVLGAAIAMSGIGAGLQWVGGEWTGDRLRRVQGMAGLLAIVVGVMWVGASL